MEDILKRILAELQELKVGQLRIEQDVKDIKEDTRNYATEFRSHFKHIESTWESHPNFSSCNR